METSTLIRFIRSEKNRSNHTNLLKRLREEVDKEDFDRNFEEVKLWLQKVTQNAQ